MCAYVLGVVRSARQLDALTYEATAATDRAVPWKQQHTCVLRPVASGSSLSIAWDALAAVTTWDATTLAHVVAVLRDTVPCIDAPEDLPALQLDVPDKTRATAAHPRGFRGTKHRPPRPAQPEATDVRPYLLARRHVDQVLELLGQPRGPNTAFDPAFVMQLWPLVRMSSEVGAFAVLARTLELSTRPELRAALVGVYLAAPEHALGWWSYVLASHDQLEVAQLVCASGVATLPVIDAELGVRIAKLAPAQQWAVYRGLVAGATPSYLFSGIALEAKLDDAPPGKIDITELIESTVARLAIAMREDSGPEFWRGYLWRLCGYQPELIEVLASPEFISLQPPAAFWLIRIANTPRWAQDGDKHWRCLSKSLPLFVEWTARLPAEYQRKFIEDLGDTYWWAYPDVDLAIDAIAMCVDLCFRVARSPFATMSVIGGVLPSLTMIYSEDNQWPARRALCAAPDASWLALEHACARDNQARLVERGFNRMGQYVPALMVSTFVTTPGALLHTAEVLAGLSFAASAQLLRKYSASALNDPGLADATLERLCEVVEPIAKAGGPNPIRRALRRYLAGDAKLGEAQLRGHRERIIADLGIVRLAAIRQAAERVLAARVGIETVESTSARHALAMIGEAEANGRQLRRMLAATMTGDRDWKLRHARTRDWFVRHPKLDRAAWLEGLRTEGVVAGIGPIRLATETDPLEALKLGTYVGSCIGFGGAFAYSAAAVALDVNKQVAYARDVTGAVVGRQLLAISEADELVCFSIYGSAKTELLEPLFRDFDRRLAAKLGLAIGGDDYTVAMILSHDWYDDLALRADPA